MNNIEYSEAVRWLAERARTDFLAYILLMRCRDTKFTMGDLHRFLASLIQGVVDGNLRKRQCVSVPPQHGKSTILSVEAPSWLIGAKPDTNVAITGYSYGLTTDFSRAVRDRISDPLYQLVFPDVAIADGQGKADKWSLTNGSGVIAKSVGSKLTGRKVDWLIIDDAHAGRAEAESVLQRQRVRQWFYGDCITRMSPDGSIFIIGTRWHPEDLIGALTDKDNVARMIADGAPEEVFQVTNLKASADEEDPMGREVGESLFPEVRHAKFLNAVRASIPSYEWSSQYQGEPQSAATNIIATDRLNFIDEDEIPYEDLEIVRGWDLALTEKQTSDWSVGALVAGCKPSKEMIDAARAEGLPDPLPTFYIIDMFRAKMNWTKLRSKIKAVSFSDLDRFNVGRIGMEAVAAFDIALRETREDLRGKVVVEKRNPRNNGKRNQSSKLMRAQPWINLVEAGNVYVVRAKWNKELVAEMLTFPEGEHDDQIDGITVGYETLFVKHQLLIA